MYTIYTYEVLFLRAFASTGVVETQWAIAKNMKSPLDLSIQEFVSCSGNAGCEGGSIKSTLSWLERARYDNQVSHCYCIVFTVYTDSISIARRGFEGYGNKYILQ